MPLPVVATLKAISNRLLPSFCLLFLFLEKAIASVLRGTPLVGPLPALTAAPGRYPIAIAIGTLEADNYTIALLPGELTIRPAGTHLSLVIEPNPVRNGRLVTLTAQVTSEVGPLPAGVSFGGQVLFVIDGRKPVAVTPGVDGTAVYTLNNLKPGLHTITLEYTGDINFLGSTGGTFQLLVEGSKTYLPIAQRSGL